MAPHGHAGQVKVKFARNITAKAMGATVRIMLYPNRSIWVNRLLSWNPQIFLLFKVLNIRLLLKSLTREQSVLKEPYYELIFIKSFKWLQENICSTFCPVSWPHYIIDLIYFIIKCILFQVFIFLGFWGFGV